MTGVCAYGRPIEDGAGRCDGCEFAGKGPAPCRFPKIDLPPHPADDPAEVARHASTNGHAPGAAAELRESILSLLAGSKVGARLRDITDHCGDSARDELTAMKHDGLVTFSSGWWAVASEDEPEAEVPDAPPFPYHLARGPLAEMLDWAAEDGLPVSYMGVAVETAAAAAAARTRAGHVGAHLSLGVRKVYPVLWQALIGDSGDAKNRPPEIACEAVEAIDAGRFADWDAACEATPPGKPRPDPPEPLTLTSGTMESLARWLSATGGAGLLRVGELASFLRSLGQYKGGGGSDRYDAMDMWSCEAVSILRVGGGKAQNEVRIRVPRPRLSIIGGLTLDNLPLLGAEGDGMRARFLPVLPSSAVIPNLDGSRPLPASWATTIGKLHNCDHDRIWYLRGESRAALQAAVDEWTERKLARTDPTVILTALAKADEQALRIALTVAELETPGATTSTWAPYPVEKDIPLWAVEYAIARVNYSLGCWATLGSDQTMAFSRKDEVLSKGVQELLNRIRARNPASNGRRYMARSEIKTAKVGGARSGSQVDELIRSYLDQFPQCVTVYSDTDKSKFPGARRGDREACPAPATRGPAPVIVWEPKRAPGSPGTRPERTSGAPPESPTGLRIQTKNSGLSGVYRVCADTDAEGRNAGQRHNGWSQPPPENLSGVSCPEFSVRSFLPSGDDEDDEDSGDGGWPPDSIGAAEHRARRHQPQRLSRAQRQHQKGKQ